MATTKLTSWPNAGTWTSYTPTDSRGLCADTSVSLPGGVDAAQGMAAVVEYQNASAAGDATGQARAQKLAHALGFQLEFA